MLRGKTYALNRFWNKTVDRGTTSKVGTIKVQKGMHKITQLNCEKGSHSHIMPPHSGIVKAICNKSVQRYLEIMIDTGGPSKRKKKPPNQGDNDLVARCLR